MGHGSGKVAWNGPGRINLVRDREQASRIAWNQPWNTPSPTSTAMVSSGSVTSTISPRPSAQPIQITCKEYSQALMSPWCCWITTTFPAAVSRFSTSNLERSSNRAETPLGDLLICLDHFITQKLVKPGTIRTIESLGVFFKKIEKISWLIPSIIKTCSRKYHADILWVAILSYSHQKLFLDFLRFPSTKWLFLHRPQTSM